MGESPCTGKTHKQDGGTLLIFVDTEFAGFWGGSGKRALISIGLMSADGNGCFYAELSDTYLPEEQTKFVRMEVLPQLEGGHCSMSLFEVRLKLVSWIADLGEKVSLVCDGKSYDDEDWIEFILAETWPENLDQTIQRLSDICCTASVDAIEIARMEAECYFANHLRHHALHDAEALRRTWLALAELNGERE